jgi:hypothetical protein
MTLPEHDANNQHCLGYVACTSRAHDPHHTHGISLLIWHRVSVRGNIHIVQLYSILQTAFARSGETPHGWRVHMAWLRPETLSQGETASTHTGRVRLKHAEVVAVARHTRRRAARDAKNPVASSATYSRDPLLPFTTESGSHSYHGPACCTGSRDVRAAHSAVKSDPLGKFASLNT